MTRRASPIWRKNVSDNVRQTAASVSANLRRKLPLIARRAVYDCAPLHIGVRASRRDSPFGSIGVSAPLLKPSSHIGNGEGIADRSVALPEFGKKGEDVLELAIPVFWLLLPNPSKR